MRVAIKIDGRFITYCKPEKATKINWHEIIKHEQIPSNSNLFINYKLTLRNSSIISLSIYNKIDLPNTVGKTVIFKEGGIIIE